MNLCGHLAKVSGQAMEFKSNEIFASKRKQELQTKENARANPSRRSAT